MKKKTKQFKCRIPFYALIEITVFEESEQDAIERAVQVLAESVNMSIENECNIAELQNVEITSAYPLAQIVSGSFSHVNQLKATAEIIEEMAK